MTMLLEDFAEPSFVWSLTRRDISRITAQAYSRQGAMLSTVIMNLKICVSRACKIMGPDELDVPLATKDANFARTIAKVCSSDSVCTACLFNPEITIKNVLTKGAINSTKHRMKEIQELLPKAVIHLTWLPGEKNTADAASKLHSNSVKILISDAYRHGPNELMQAVKISCICQRG